MERYDQEEIYCRMLGHHLGFAYCRTVNEALPCRKIADCWFERLPIDEFLKTHYSESVLEMLSAPPEPRLVSILRLVEQARSKKS